MSKDTNNHIVINEINISENGMLEYNYILNLSQNVSRTNSTIEQNDGKILVLLIK